MPLGQAQDESSSGPSFLVYHVVGGRDPDPLASRLVDTPDVERLPATFFDRAERADAAPENAPESAPAHYREMERRLSARETMGTPRLFLTVVHEGDLLLATVRGEGNGTLNTSFVVFEHGATLGGVPQPYVARFSTASSDLPANASRGAQIRVDPSWNEGRLGVVAIAREGEEIVQSATWIEGGDSTVRQLSKGVLVEHVTASWCTACRPADEAFALLSLQRGAGGPLESGDATYFRAPSWRLYAGLVIGGMVALVIFRRRAA